jgi:hypothetical protein
MTAPVRGDVQVNFKATGVESVKSATDKASTNLRQVGGGLRQVAGGLEIVARNGALTGEALKQVVAQGAEIAFMFGAAGPIVGALGILGVAIFENITRKMKEAEEQTNKTRKELEAITDLPTAGKRQQSIFSGNPNAIRLEGESTAAFVARQQGLGGVTARVRALQGNIPNVAIEAVARGMRSVGDIGGSKELGEFIEQMARLREEFAQITPITERLSDLEGKRARNQVTQADAEAIKALPLSLAAINRDNAMTARLAGVADLRNLPGIQRSALGGTLTTTPIGGLEGHRAFGIKAPDVSLFASKATEDMLNGIKSMAEQIQSALATGLGDAISAGFDAAFAKGGNIGKAGAALGAAALKTLGGVFKTIGQQSLIGLNFMESIKNAIIGFAPGLGIAAAVGLIAFGSLLQAAGGRMQDNASGGGSRSVSPSGYSGGVNAPIVVQPVGRMASVGGLSGGMTVINANIVGLNDPGAQRQVADLLSRGSRRSF